MSKFNSEVGVSFDPELCSCANNHFAHLRPFFTELVSREKAKSCGLSKNDGNQHLSCNRYLNPSSLDSLPSGNVNNGITYLYAIPLLHSVGVLLGICVKNTHYTHLVISDSNTVRLHCSDMLISCFAPSTMKRSMIAMDMAWRAKYPSTCSLSMHAWILYFRTKTNT